MKISDNNFLWKCYQRAYRDKPFQHPRSLCRFFWVALGGFLTMFILDWSFKLFWPCCLVVAVASIWLIHLYEDSLPPVVLVPLVAVINISSFLVLLIPLFRFGRWLESQPRRTRHLVCGFNITLFLIVPLAVGLTATDVNWPQFLRSSGLALSILLGLFLAMVLVRAGYLFIYHRASMIETGRTILAFLKTSKEKVCPPVELPDSYPTENREPPL
jgi:hypothetical protein